MKAAYGSSWPPKHEGVEGKAAQYRMPPLLRLNSTGEVSSGAEKPPHVMGQHRTPRSSPRASKSFLGNVASRLMPPSGRAEQHLVDIHSAVGGIASLEEQLFGTKTMAGYAAKKEVLPVGHQPTKMSHPFGSHPRPHPNRYGRWAVDGLSPWMQPGVFPCHVFSAVQLGVPLQQFSPSLWNGQQRVQASVSDSVLNCHIGQFAASVPFNISPCKGRTMHNSSDKNTGSSSQPRAAMTDRGHCIGVTRHQHQNHPQRGTFPCTETETSKDCDSKYSQGKHSANSPVSCGKSESGVSKTEGRCTCMNHKTAENQPCREFIIPSSCDTNVSTPTVSTAHISISKMPNFLPHNIHQQSSECDFSVLSSESSLEGGAQGEEEGPGSAVGLAEAAIDDIVTDKGAASLPCQNHSPAAVGSDVASDTQSSISPSLSSADPAVSSSCSESDTADFGAAGVKFDDEVNIKSDASTAASGQDNHHANESSKGSISCMDAFPIKSESAKSQSCLHGDLHTEPAIQFQEETSSTDDVVEEDDSDVDWDTEDEDEDDEVPDDDFILELSFPVLSNFLPGQSPQSCTASSRSASGRQCAAAAAARCMVGRMLDTFEVLFFGDEGENQGADTVDGQINRHEVGGEDVSRPGHSIPCPAANARWDRHYASEVPEKINAKVSFHCGKGVDQYHEIEQVEVDAEDASDSGMTFMERQKLMDQRKGHPLSRIDSTESDPDM